MSHKVGTATQVNYVWDVNRSVPEILQDGTNTYVYGLGRISSTDGSGVQTYYDADGLGSTGDLTNSAATKTDSYTYDAFGTSTHTSGTSANAFQFTGQQTDADSGLQYLRARYYDPATGRFLGRDPLAGQLDKPVTLNRYPYVLNNPTTLVDPLGLCGWFDDPLECAQNATKDALNGAVDVITDPTIADIVAWYDVVPYSGWSVDVAAAALTEIQILTSECSNKVKFGTSIMNGGNLVIGVGGGYVAGTVTVEAAPAGILISIEVSAVEATLTASTSHALAACEDSQGNSIAVYAASASRVSGHPPRPKE